MSVSRYFKFDEINQFLEDQDDINYFATNQVRRIAVGNMLGDFDENGIYVLDKNVIKQLISMPKIIVDSVASADLIRSAIKFDSFIHFMLAIEDDKAKLVLLEKINFEANIKYNAGSYSNMNEYVLCEISIPDQDIDRNTIYTKLNIRREDEGRYYDLNDLTNQELSNFDAIIDKIKYNFLTQNLMIKKEKEIEIIEADYFDNVLASFEDKKQKQEFEKMLKSMIAEKKDFILIDRPFFQKTINEILDNCLSFYFLNLSPENRAKIEEKIREAKKKYYTEYNNLLHINFVADANVQLEATENSIINDMASTLQQEEVVKVMRIDVKKEELEKSFSAVMEENQKLKDNLAHNNSNGKTIKEDNPELSKLFTDIQKEYNFDMLQPSNKVVENKEETKTSTQEKKDTVAKKSNIINTNKQNQQTETNNADKENTKETGQAKASNSTNAKEEKSTKVENTTPKKTSTNEENQSTTKQKFKEISSSADYSTGQSAKGRINTPPNTNVVNGFSQHLSNGQRTNSNTATGFAQFLDKRVEVEDHNGLTK